MGNPIKAKLQVLEDKAKSTTPLQGPQYTVEAQFNPQSLQVTYHTIGKDAANKADGKGVKNSAPDQQTGSIADVLFDLLFDTTEDGTDVRLTTLKLAAMMRSDILSKTNASKTAPSTPRVRFQWGTFVFYGQIQSMSETLDFFSEDGVALRSTVKITMTEEPLDRIDVQNLGNALASAGGGIGLSASAGVSAGVGAGAGIGFSASASLSAGIGIGSTPLTMAQAGDSLQALAGRAGLSASWKGIAAANNIDNPRAIPAGTPLNLSASASAGASASFGDGTASASAGASASFGV